MEVIYKEVWKREHSFEDKSKVVKKVKILVPGKPGSDEAHPELGSVMLECFGIGPRGGFQSIGYPGFTPQEWDEIIDAIELARRYMIPKQEVR